MSEENVIDFYFFNITYHCQMNQYNIEFLVCGMDGCHICGRVGRSVLTPFASNAEIRKEVLQWVELPVVNPIDRDHFLSPDNTICYINNDNVPFEELNNVPPDAKVDSKEKLILSNSTEKDKESKKLFFA